MTRTASKPAPSNTANDKLRMQTRPHLIHLANDGALLSDGPDANTAADIEKLILEDMPRQMKRWAKKRVMLYAHGGVVDADSAVRHAMRNAPLFLKEQIYPLFFIWRSDPISSLQFTWEDLWNTLKPKAILSEDQIDGFLEWLAPRAGVKVLWDQMKDNATKATINPKGGARLVAGLLGQLMASVPGLELNLVGHSAGGIFHAPLTQLVTSAADKPINTGPLKGETGLGLKLKTIQLWAPGSTLALCKQTYWPAIQAGAVQQFALYTLSDKTERDDVCANLYRKSVLYLVSNALENPPRKPGVTTPEPLLGLTRDAADDADMQAILAQPNTEWIVATESNPAEPDAKSAARNHSHFDDEPITIRTTIDKMLS
jgi:hypothetical protein